MGFSWKGAVDGLPLLIPGCGPLSEMAHGIGASAVANGVGTRFAEF